MKPAAFRFIRATSIEEAIHHLAEAGDEAKLLAGGQSLIPLMNLRLARAETLIDISSVAEMRYISIADTAEPGIRIGGGTRHQAVVLSADVRHRLPILARAASWIGHSAIRARGTIGGSLAHADPLAEHSLVALALGARVAVRSQRGVRVVPIDQFSQSAFTTALQPDEIITEVEIPLLPPGWGWGLAEHARRPGDFAVAGAVVLLQFSEGRVEGASAAYMGGPDGPASLAQHAAVLMGSTLDPGMIREWARSVAADVEVVADSAYTARARRRVLTAVLDAALSQAIGNSGSDAFMRDAS
jgi:CO/xanthine dehydrogenase FAD-binding subunit